MDDILHITEREDVWEHLQKTDKPIVMYGMGNGADKILAVMEGYGIRVADFFASDGFVRGHAFHGKTVLSYSAVREKYEDMLVVISFASQRPEVLSLFDAVDGAYETVAPDVPVSGDTLFTRSFFEARYADFCKVYGLLTDEESRRIYCDILSYKISGKLSYLRRAVSDPREIDEGLLHTGDLKSYMDLGAYTGDSIRTLLAASPGMERVWAMEPDARNLKKLTMYAAEETRAQISVHPHAAWCEDTTLTFLGEGNRNSAVAANAMTGHAAKQAKEKTVSAAAPDGILSGAPVDYIKYDVEGAEREAILGTRETIRTYAPKLLVSLYHRTEDLIELPLLLHALQPRYRLYLRRFPYVPAWDINLYCIPEAE